MTDLSHGLSTFNSYLELPQNTSKGVHIMFHVGRHVPIPPDTDLNALQVR